MNAQIRRVAMVVVALFVALFLQLNYLQVVSAKRLANHPGNVRSVIRDYSRPRGEILSADEQVLAQSKPTGDEFKHLRVYPAGPLFAHTTGFFSFTFGTSGVEKTYNGDLTGRSQPLRKLTEELIGREHTGTVVLTLDSKAQQAAHDALAGRRGSVVVIRPKTGEIVALYSEPSFDPTPLSAHNQRDVRDAFRKFDSDPGHPMLARTFRERYPAGSTFKIITAATAIEHNVATPQTSFPTLRQLDLPQSDKFIHNFGGKSCGGTMAESFRVSCNTTFAALGLQLGETLVDGMDAFGVGEPVPFDLAAVTSAGPRHGTFAHNQPAFANAAIGQQDVAVTPLQMALVASAIADGGVIMTPHVGHEVRDVDGRVLRTVAAKEWRRAVSPGTADAVKQMMIDVVRAGTATRAQIPGITVAGKTGTAQAPGGPPHAWFVGFAPANDAQYAIAVIVERGGNLGDEATGGRVAAPVARRVLGALLGK